MPCPSLSIRRYFARFISGSDPRLPHGGISHRNASPRLYKFNVANSSLSFSVDCWAILLDAQSFVRVVHLLRDELGHGEHVDFVLSEDFSHPTVTDDISFVRWVLEVVGFDVLPYLLGRFRPRKLFGQSWF